MPRSACIEQGEQFTCNHYLQSFLTYLKQERGFVDPTTGGGHGRLRPVDA